MSAMPRRLLIWFAVSIFGALVLWFAFGDPRFQTLGDGAQMAILMAGMVAAMFGPVIFLMTLLAAIGAAGLKAGRNVIARWHLTAAEWDRFRVIDARQAGLSGPRTRDQWVSGPTPPDGVAIIFGKRGVLVGETYQSLRPLGLPEMRAVNWLTTDPECLDFTLLYPRGRYGGTVTIRVQVPVSRQERQAAIGVFEHFRSIIPVRKPGLAFRYPTQTILGGLAFAALSGVMALVAWAVLDPSSEIGATLMITGIASAIAALIVTALISLIVQPWRER